MNNLTNNKVQVKLLNAGVSHGVDRELLGSLDKNLVLDQKNFRPTSDTGNYGALESIWGNELLYDFSAQGLGVEYRCAFGVEVNGILIGLWVPITSGYSTILTFDGDVVLKTQSLGYTNASIIDFDVVDKGIDGLIIITDNVKPPIYLDVNDIQESFFSGSLKYFDEFDINNHIINLEGYIDQPVFSDLVSVGAGGGVPPGRYSYGIRYVTESGDKTGVSPFSHQIPVPAEYDLISTNIFPHSKTRGADSNLASPTKYGVKIKFRIANLYSYDYIEIIRIDHNDGGSLTETPSAYVIDKIPIEDQQIEVYEYIDSNQIDETYELADTTDSESNLVIEAAQSVRYFRNRVHLFNVLYASKDVQDEVEFIDNNGKIYPFIENLGFSGYKLMKNQVERVSYMRGEEYGFVAVLRDSKMSRSLAVPIRFLQMPNRRVPIQSPSVDESDTPTVAADVNGNVGETYEVFDMINAFRKTTFYDGEYVNIAAEGSKDGTSASDVGYKPRRPKTISDKQNNYGIRNLVNVYPDGSTKTQYDPNGYKPEVKALGLVFEGISEMPSWVKGFTIERTRPANKVVAQGIGFYSLVSGVDGVSEGRKNHNEIWFFSPDIENGMVDSVIVEDMNQNPQNYQLQFVSPLGFFEDIFCHERTGIGADRLVDMAVYARIIAEYDSLRCNVGEPATNVGIVDSGNGYVAYGKWRNTDLSHPVFINLENGESLVDILDVQNVLTDEEGVSFFKIGLNSTMYQHEVLGGGNGEFNTPEMREWCEPVYMVNIVQVGATADKGDNTAFDQIGVYQRVESFIGIYSSLTGGSYEISGERLEDFHAVDPSEDKYIFIREAGVDKRFININNKSGGSISTIKDDIDNSTSNYNGLDLHGIYTSTEGIIHFSEAGYTPSEGASIFVKYDNRFPIKFFGGDTFISDCYWPMIHNKAAAAIGDVDFQFFMGHGMPYHKTQMNENIFQIKRANSDIDRIQDSNDNLKLGFIRQMLVNFICETRSNLPLVYGYGFPLVNYIERPHRWNSNNYDNNFRASGVGVIYDDYRTDYPDEELRWEFGGFPIHWYLMNSDYSKHLNYLLSFQRPTVGYTEQLRYRNRVQTSLPRQSGNVNNDRLKTFPVNNYYDIDEKNGDIVKGWSGSTDYGDNLYALTEKGICLLITDKRLLSQITGDELSVMGVGAGASFVQSEKWISNSVGLPKLFFRSFSEFDNTFVIVNKYGIFVFGNNAITNILTEKYKSVIMPKIESVKNYNIDSVTTVIDTRYNEVWVQFSLLDTDASSSGGGEESIGDDLIDFTNKTIVNFTPVDNQKVFIHGNVLDGDPVVQINPVVFFYKVIFFQFSESDVDVCIRNISDGDIAVAISINGSYTGQRVVLGVGDHVQISYNSTAGSADFLASPSCENASIPIDTFMYAFSDQEDVSNWIGRFGYSHERFLSFDRKTYGFGDLLIKEVHKGHQIDGVNIDSYVIVPFAPDRIYNKEFEAFYVNSNKKPFSFEILDSNLNVVKTINANDINDFKHKFGQYAGRRDDTNDRIQGTHSFLKINFVGNEQFVVRSALTEYKILK